MRRFAVVGDKLTNGGAVCHYEGMMFTMGDGGHQAALINGEAYCPVCKTTGYIAKSGGGRRMTLGTSEIALDRDFVVCGCPEHPRISAKLAGEAWYDDLAESRCVMDSRTTASASDSSIASTFDEQVRVAGHGAFHGYPYYVETSEGRVYSGRLDSDNKLPRIDTGATAGRYTIYWGDEALSHEGWSNAE